MTLWQTSLPDLTQGLYQQKELTLLTMCLWGEARGSSGEAQRAVGFVVRNRVERRQPRFGMGWREVILKPYQFSVFNRENGAPERLFHPLENDSEQAWKSCYASALIAYEELYKDPTGKALFYYSCRTAPAWAHRIRETLRLDDFVFLTDQA
jgi:spore germination cell wall hydrolase CwlJ-like protein